MIKFVAHKDGKPLYGFGLTEGNCKLLLEGKPVLIDLDVLCSSLPPDGHRGAVMIFGGENEAAMAAELERHVGPETVVRDYRMPHLRDDHSNPKGTR